MFLRIHIASSTRIGFEYSGEWFSIIGLAATIMLSVCYLFYKNTRLIFGQNFTTTPASAEEQKCSI